MKVIIWLLVSILVCAYLGYHVEQGYWIGFGAWVPTGVMSMRFLLKALEE